MLSRRCIVQRASGRELELAVHLEADLHLALPENAAFLQADLSGDPEAALAVAEHAGLACRDVSNVRDVPDVRSVPNVSDDAGSPPSRG